MNVVSSFAQDGGSSLWDWCAVFFFVFANEG
jgi:hypothetical protein